VTAAAGGNSSNNSSTQQQQWPAEYGGAVFVAEHGSWNRDTPIGYRIAAVQLSPDGRSIVGHQLFAEWWLRSDSEAWGRPVGLLRLPDGSMLVGDDEANVGYRISYDPSSPPAPQAGAGAGSSSGACGGQRTSAVVAALAAAAAMLHLLAVLLCIINFTRCTSCYSHRLYGVVSCLAEEPWGAWSSHCRPT
jgi:hypothetical protein